MGSAPNLKFAGDHIKDFQCKLTFSLSSANSSDAQRSSASACAVEPCAAPARRNHRSTKSTLECQEPRARPQKTHKHESIRQRSLRDAQDVSNTYATATSWLKASSAQRNTIP
eukprot:293691-Amphidinium_carterae.1